MKGLTGVKEGVVCVKLTLSKGQNLMFTQANVSCWLTQANPFLPSPALQLPPKAPNSPDSAVRAPELGVLLQASGVNGRS